MMISLLLLLVTMYGCSYSSTVVYHVTMPVMPTTVPLAPEQEQEDEQEGEQAPERTVCAVFRGEEQSFEDIWVHRGYDFMSNACI